MNHAKNDEASSQASTPQELDSARCNDWTRGARVKPALNFLSQPFLKGAQHEFLRAHEHYRAGRSKEALNESLKAFESTLKSVCVKRKWPLPLGGHGQGDSVQVVPLFMVSYVLHMTAAAIVFVADAEAAL